MARLGGALFLGCLSLAAAGSAQTDLKLGDTFPALRADDLEGPLPTVLSGQVVVVEFWASWCGPCRHTFPLMEELHHRFQKQGLVVLGINEDRSKVAMTEFLKDYPVSFTVVRDARKKLAASLNVPGPPCSYIIDRAGKVRSILTGEQIVQNRKGFIRQIEVLLAEPAREAPR